MAMNAELVAILGAAVASSFALVRMSLGQHRSLIDRFVSFLETGMKRSDRANERIAAAVDALGETVRENTAVISRLTDRMPHTFGEDTPWR
ncbi:MAG: hypothetical protein HONBIEJF_02100 [Fimbriimonadaceae bacterium]|nr:hypothetical protein [Fimbriimonadaceae bacterium]